MNWGTADVWVHLSPGMKEIPLGRGEWNRRQERAQDPASVILEEKELAGGARGVREKGSDNRTGPHSHSGFSSRYRVLWQGSNGVASEGSCRNVDRLRGHRIWWLLFLKELRGKVIVSVGGEESRSKALSELCCPLGHC